MKGSVEKGTFTAT